MIRVKTGSKDLRFKVQGKIVDSEKSVSVRMDHNVQSKINDGSLVIVKKPAKKIMEPDKIKKENKLIQNT